MRSYPAGRLEVRRVSRLEGTTPTLDLERFEVLIDLVDVYDDRDELLDTEHVTRTVIERIPKGTPIALRHGRWIGPARRTT